MNKGQRLTAADVARLAGVSRPTISRALKSGALHGLRDNSGRWTIAAEDAESWITAQRAHSAHEQPKAATEQTNAQLEQLRASLAETRESLAAAKAENLGLKDRLADTQADRDRLAELLKDALSKPQSVSLFRRWFG